MLSTRRECSSGGHFRSMRNLIREGSLTALVFTFDNNVVYYFVLFQIPADSALVFQVELLKIERKEEL